VVVEEGGAVAIEVATEVTQGFLRMAVVGAGSFFLSHAPQSILTLGRGRGRGF